MSGTRGVYAIINVLDGKKYVGSASLSIEKRWNDHRRDLRQGKHHSRYLQRAWVKYGESAFQFQILAICDPDRCVKTEQLWIDCFRAADPEFGYNMSPTAGSTLGTKHRPESIDKMRKAKRGHKQSEEWVARRAASMINRGTPRKSVKHTAEHRANNSAAHKGIVFSDEHRSNLSAKARKRYEASRVEFRGEKRNLKEICEELGMRYRTVWSRINNSCWSVEAALTTPIKMAGGGAEEGT